MCLGAGKAQLLRLLHDTTVPQIPDLIIMHSVSIYLYGFTMNYLNKLNLTM